MTRVLRDSTVPKSSGAKIKDLKTTPVGATLARKIEKVASQ